jgi:hypothetical protein
MKIKEAKTFFDHGIIRGFRAVFEPMTIGYVLIFQKSTGDDDVLETASGERRVFSSIVTLLKTVRDVGGETCIVDMSTVKRLHASRPRGSI